MNAHQKERLMRLEGLVAASYWDEKADQWWIALITEDDDEYFIDSEGKGKILQDDYLYKHLVVWGYVRVLKGKKVIRVLDFFRADDLLGDRCLSDDVLSRETLDTLLNR